MPSKLRKAIGAVKDQTSISLAKVSSSSFSHLGITVLKATTHDDVPVDDRYVNDILLLISSNKVYAAAAAQAIGKRIGRTRNWIVALKSLSLVLKIFQDGDPYFPREVLQVMNRGARILNLSGFKDDSSSSPWDYTAFVRTFALYLDERLDCFLAGKFQRRSQRRCGEPVRDMKPPVLLDRISFWQRLLDRAIATQPTGAARSNPLVLISLHAVATESFELYRDISNALALLLDSFFHLQYQSCVSAFHACVRASKQFEELSAFYSLCKSIGVGRTSEYPSVHKISDELIQTLQEFLKDQASFPTGKLIGPSMPPPPQPPPPPQESQSPSRDSERSSERGSDWGSQRTSLEDLITPTEAAAFSSLAIENQTQHSENLEPQEDLISREEGLDPSTNPSADGFAFFDTWWDQIQEQQSKPKPNANQSPPPSSSQAEADCWELVLLGTASSQAKPESPNKAFPPDILNNPFLLEATEFAAADSHHGGFPDSGAFGVAPTFSATNSNETAAFKAEDDPFDDWAPPAATAGGLLLLEGPVSRQNLEQEQKLWIEHQNKIIAKHLS